MSREVQVVVGINTLHEHRTVIAELLRKQIIGDLQRLVILQRSSQDRLPDFTHPEKRCGFPNITTTIVRPNGELCVPLILNGTDAVLADTAMNLRQQVGLDTAGNLGTLNCIYVHSQTVVEDLADLFQLFEDGRDAGLVEEVTADCAGDQNRAATCRRKGNIPRLHQLRDSNEGIINFDWGHKYVGAAGRKDIEYSFLDE